MKSSQFTYKVWLNIFSSKWFRSLSIHNPIYGLTWPWVYILPATPSSFPRPISKITWNYAILVSRHHLPHTRVYMCHRRGLLQKPKKLMSAVCGAFAKAGKNHEVRDTSCPENTDILYSVMTKRQEQKEMQDIHCDIEDIICRVFFYWIDIQT